MARTHLGLLSCAGVMALVANAHAQAPTPESTTAPPGDELRGARYETEPDSATCRFERDVLVVPATLVRLIFLPLRFGVWVIDRYHVVDLWHRYFFNADLTFHITPTLTYQTGFGLMVGAEIGAKNLFGQHEHMTVLGAWGGTYRSQVNAAIDSGTRFAPFYVQASGDFLREPNLPFYGIGNADQADPSLLLDPVTPVAVKTHYRYRELRGGATAGVRLIPDLKLDIIGRAFYTNLKYGPPVSGRSITAVYDTALLGGFNTGVEEVYASLEVRLDTRHKPRNVLEARTRASGYLASVFAGPVFRTDHEGPDFEHYGWDFQAMFHTGFGPRVLSLRFAGEGVTGPVHEVPFTELPYLGGDILRGYPFQRFRDRIAAWATVEYSWDLSPFLSTFVFSDVGRVYRGVDEITLDGMRAGFGLGMEIRSKNGFLGTGTLAFSKDGDVIVLASFTPNFDHRPVWP